MPALPFLVFYLVQARTLAQLRRLNSFGRRRFAVAGPSTRNSLLDNLRDPELNLDTFKRQLKTYCTCLRNIDDKMYSAH